MKTKEYVLVKLPLDAVEKLLLIMKREGFMDTTKALDVIIARWLATQPDNGEKGA